MGFGIGGFGIPNVGGVLPAAFVEGIVAATEAGVAVVETGADTLGAVGMLEGKFAGANPPLFAPFNFS